MFFQLELIGTAVDLSSSLSILSIIPTIPTRNPVLTHKIPILLCRNRFPSRPSSFLAGQTVHQPRSNASTNGSRNRLQQRDAPTLADPSARNQNLPAALTIFRTAIGINTTPDYTRSATRSAHNRGIYARTCRAERSAHALYITTTLLLNTCLLLQILIAACLTALGAANASHITIAVLGVLNTAIAFVLTFMQGKGLPGNHQRKWGELAGLRELIELRERELGVGGEAEGRDVKEVMREVVAAYHGVRRGAENEDIKAREANGTEGQLGAEQKDVKVVGS